MKDGSTFKYHKGMYGGVSRFGRSTVKVDCPFCGTTVVAFLWSLAGSGKRCDCGAVLGTIGAVKKPAKERNVNP